MKYLAMIMHKSNYIKAAIRLIKEFPVTITMVTIGLLFEFILEAPFRLMLWSDKRRKSG